MINVFQPTLGGEEIYATQEVMRSNWIGRGSVTRRFEEGWASHVGQDKKHIISTTCATEGLFQICESIGIGVDDEVIMPTASFVGAANAVSYVAGMPTFCDVDDRTMNPTLAHIDAKKNKRTKAVLLLHYGGVPPEELGDISQWCRHNNIYLIEDAACAPASKYKGLACGTIGDFGAWSFDAMKIMSTGDGGMVYAASEELSKTMRQDMYLGMSSESGFSSQDRARWWEFDLSYPGRRAIMNDITASIGLAQLEKLPSFVAKRATIESLYISELSGVGDISMPPVPSQFVDVSHYLFWIQTSKRDELAVYLKANGVYTTFRYYPLHMTNFYRDGNRYPGAEAAANNTLLLPLHQGLSTNDVFRVIELVRKFYEL